MHIGNRDDHWKETCSASVVRSREELDEARRLEGAQHILAGLGRILRSRRPVLLGPPERRRSTRELLLVESLVLPLRGAGMRMHCPLAPRRSRDVVPSR